MRYLKIAKICFILIILSGSNFVFSAITDCANGPMPADQIKGEAICEDLKFTPASVTSCFTPATVGTGQAVCTLKGGVWENNQCSGAKEVVQRSAEEAAQWKEDILIAHNGSSYFCDGLSHTILDPTWESYTATEWCTAVQKKEINGIALEGAKRYRIQGDRPAAPDDCNTPTTSTWYGVAKLIRTYFCETGFQQKTINGKLMCWKMPEQKPAGGGDRPPSPPGDGGDEPTESPPSSSDGCDTGSSDGDNEDKTGNPVSLISGQKYLTQVDYRHPQGLEFVRYYKSFAHHRPWSEPLDEPFMMGSHWASTYDRRVFPPSPDSLLLGTVLHPDGTITYFNLDGTEFNNTDKVANKLEKFVDGSGVTTGWAYTNDNDDIENFDAHGKLSSIVSRSGRKITISYNPEGRISSATDDVGNSLAFAYNALGRMVAMTVPSGAVYRYSYYDGYRKDDLSSIPSAETDGNTGVLAQVIYPDDTVDESDNPRKTYLYFPGVSGALIDRDLISGIVDEEGQRFSTYLYASDGKVVSSYHGTDTLRVNDPSYAGNVRNDFSYQNGNVVAVSDELGTTVSIAGTAVGGVSKGSSRTAPVNGCDGRTMNRTYDANGNVASRTFFGGKTASYLYDGNRRITSRTEAAGTSNEYTVTTLWGPSWDPDWQLPTKVTRPGLEISYIYDFRGNLTSKELKDLNTSETLTWATSYQYSNVSGASGLVVQKTIDGPISGALDQTKYYYYDADEACTGGHAGCRGQLKRIENALSQNTYFTKYNANGQLEEMVDANGVSTTMTYSPRGWLLSVTKASATTNYEYFSTGLLKRAAFPDGDWIEYSYNDAHELVGALNHKGETIDVTRSIDTVSHAKTVVSSFKTSSAQEVLKKTSVFGHHALLLNQLGNNGQETEYVYDSGSRLKEVLRYGFGVANDTLLTEYEVNQNTGLVDKEYLPKKDGPNARGTGNYISYAYDVNRRLASISDVSSPGTYRHTFTYDGFGRLVNEWSPQTGNTNYFYNSSGQMYKKIMAAGSGNQTVLRYQYDSLGRLIQMGYGVTVTWTHQWNYDDATSGNYGVGRLAYVTDPSGRTDYQYDAFGHIVSEQRQINIPGGGMATTTTAFAYSPGGKLTQVTYPGGRVVDYTQSNGDVSSVATQLGVNARTIYSNITYQPFGGWNQVMLPEQGSGYLARSFDLDGRLQQWASLDANGVMGNLYRNYFYDNFNNIASIDYGDDPSLNSAYSYDEQQRLISSKDAQGIWGYSYKDSNDIDTLGDRTRRTLQRVDPVTQVGVGPYVLDESYTYSSNRLAGVTRDVTQYPCNPSDPSRTGTPAIPCDSPSNVRTMTYDARGNLITDDRGDDQGITLQYDVYGRVIQVSGMQQ